MNMKYALSSILLCFSLFCLPSCNDNETPANTPDGEEVEEVIKVTIGNWKVSGNMHRIMAMISPEHLFSRKTVKALMTTVRWNGTVPTIICTLISTTANPSKIVTICFMGQLFS